MSDPYAVENFWRKHVVSAPWFKADKECLVVFLLDTRRQVLGFEMLSQGTKDTVLVNIPEVFRLAAIKNADAIIVAHNHPSGLPMPSEADIKVTRDLIRAGALLKIEVLDHVIIGTPMEAGAFCQASLRALGYFFDFEGVIGYSITADGQSAVPAVVGMKLIEKSDASKAEAPARASVISEKPDMEYAVQYTLGLLNLLARMTAVQTRGNGTHRSSTACGCSMWTDACGKAIYDAWNAAHDAKRPSGGKVLSAGDKAGLIRILGVTVSKATALLLMLAHELSVGWFDEYDRAEVNCELPPADSSPYLSLATDCVEYLEASFNADFGRALNSAEEQRAAA